MNFDSSKDYYKILGVPDNATPEAIRDAYRKRVKEIGLDRLIGLLNKTTDEDVKKVIQEQIHLKTEVMQEVNEAKEVLSSVAKRADYDAIRKTAHKGATDAPPPKPKPVIVFSKVTLNFGTVAKGDGGSKTVTITNRGGMPDTIEISWDTQPTWAKPLVIEPDPVNTFPIAVTVEIKTGRITPASYTTDIVVTAGGEEFRLPVHLKVAEAVVPKATPADPLPKPTTATTTGRTAKFTPPPVYAPPATSRVPWGIIVVAVVIVGIIVVGIANTGGQSSPNPESTSCNITHPSRLHVGGYAYPSDNGYLITYPAPSLSSADSDDLQLPQTVPIVGGPVIADGGTWWNIKAIKAGEEYHYWSPENIGFYGTCGYLLDPR